jgi:AraC-like DNA-binding protein
LTAGDTPLTFRAADIEGTLRAPRSVTRGTIAVSATTGLLDTIAASGANADEILRTVGLKRSVLANPDGRIACSTFARVLEEAARATADDCFGLHFGEHFDPKDIGALVYVVANSPTISIAIQNTERYLRIHNNAARTAFSIEGQRGYLRYVLSESDLHWSRQHNEFSMAVGLRVFRMVAGDRFRPLEVQFTHDTPSRTSEHERVFGCRILFACSANALVLERDVVERLVPAADNRLYRILKEHADRVLSEMPRENDFLGAVRSAIGESIAEGDPKRTRIARKLTMSPRTLERRLKQHGVVYKGLVNDTRRRFALDYLRDRRHTVTQVAFLLGYSEVSAFNRRFQALDRFDAPRIQGHERPLS